MENLLSGAKLSEELDFFRKHVDQLGALKVKVPPSYVPPLEHRPKRATLAAIPLCDPPVAASDDRPSAVETVTLTIKSVKPPLLFTLDAPSTSTIASLKALLSKREPTAPLPEAQRWILKGKALADGKLLREYDVADGAVVNLMVKAIVAAPSPEPPTTEVHDPTGIPSLTLSTAPSLSSPATSSAANTPSHPLPEFEFAAPRDSSPSTASESFLSTMSNPDVWIDALQMLEKHFGDSEEGRVDARKAWESWLEGSMGWISASEKALIRERAGVSAMGGLV